MALGKKIRSLREELGLSQAQLSAHGGLSQGYLSQLENDEVNNPSAAIIFRLAQALNVDPRVLMQAAGYDDLVNGSDEEYEVSVDPELLRFLTRFPREQQAHLLRVLQGLDGSNAAVTRTPVDSRSSVSAPAPRRNRSRVVAG